MSSQGDSEVPSRPKEQQGEANAPSKSAQKKAEKDKVKAEKAAKRQELERQQKEQADANDTAKHLYGSMPSSSASPANRPEQKFTELAELYDAKENQEVTIDARVHNARVQSAKLAFLVLRAEAHTIQVVIAEGGTNKISRQMVKWCGGVNSESIVRVTGLIKQPVEPVTSTSISNFELHVESIYMISEAAQMLPVQVKDCMRAPPMNDDDSKDEAETDSQGLPVVTLNARLNNRVLDGRTAANLAIFQLQGGICNLFIEFMNQNQFTWINSSRLAGASTEGGAGVFEIKYFDTKAYLTQSPQFFKQMAIAMDMKRVCEIGPVFRAENSNTHRHLTEFTGLDFEMVIKNDYHEVLSFGEKLMLYIIRNLQERPEFKRLTKVVDQVFPGAGDFRLPSSDKALRLTFAEAVKLLNDNGIAASEVDDLSTAQEKALGRIIREKADTDFYTIDKFPSAVRAFYTMPDPSNPKVSNSYDFFMRGQEIMSGAQRIHDYNQLCERMRANDPPLDPLSEGFRHYTDAFKYGCAPHGGGGLGLNRILQFYLGLPDIRFATLFPRDPGRLAP
ncbi:MAG: hypothetical protein L6R40_005754 [Gallowayella cf. fulva]|nr:MAG: hypothetical protein L6R40_005754 [Xanthomendoza cf. fulva]